MLKVKRLQERKSDKVVIVLKKLFEKDYDLMNVKNYFFIDLKFFIDLLSM